MAAAADGAGWFADLRAQPGWASGLPQAFCLRARSSGAHLPGGCGPCRGTRLEALSAAFLSAFERCQRHHAHPSRPRDRCGRKAAAWKRMRRFLAAAPRASARTAMQAIRARRRSLPRPHARANAQPRGDRRARSARLNRMTRAAESPADHPRHQIALKLQQRPQQRRGGRARALPVYAIAVAASPDAAANWAISLARRHAESPALPSWRRRRSRCAARAARAWQRRAGACPFGRCF
eukprot:351083-Chlamydomonas_euryale.AAC.3